ncbi:peptidylprolyl isomerase [Methanofollis sp. W23]|uniref:FKBP-type peptidyl-prolyl cis-trans isomerase n=1 Tax=Methanofollis sp. W23 TaxID=2817849 RepID=UPI001AE139FE|nr:peptidylprolyl isomerase [Methanofollis sp. W23]MBP2145142.1 peptidylprolyl isomerase [Methanofollis sp. W23]
MNYLAGIVMVAALVLAAGCVGAGTKPTAGDNVSVKYTGTFENGTIFDSNVGKEAFTFTIGEQQVIPGFEKAVLGLSEGESVTVTVPVEEAYGEYNPALVSTVNRSEFPDELAVVGTPFMMPGQNAIFRVTAVNETTVTIDGNHPLAGENLTFSITLLSIQGHGDA